MPATYEVRDTGSLASSTQSNIVIGRSVDISLSGTWVGTVKLQRYMAGDWRDTGDTWTANVEAVADSARFTQWRLDFTRTSGTLVYELRGDDMDQ